MSTQEIAVVGIARNVEATLRRETRRLNLELTKIFKRVSFFIVESDSSDKSVEELSKLKDRIPNFSFVSLGNIQPKIPDRIERLRFCRNQYVAWLQSSTAPYVLVCDFDIVSKQFLSKDLHLAMSNLPEWDGIFTNQKGRYYDIFALRHPEWSPDDCYVNYKTLRNKMAIGEAKNLAIWSRMRKISLESNPIEVDSAFGGMGLYRSGVFKTFDYTPDENSVPGECEHVTLNRKIRRAGGRLFIVPSFTNFSWNTTNLSYYRVFRPIERLGKTTTLRAGLRKVRKLLP